MPVTEQTQTQTEVKVEAVNTQTQASTMASTRADPSRVLLAGDWHGNLGWGLAVVDHAADAHAEVIVHVGDFGIWPGSATCTSSISGCSSAACDWPSSTATTRTSTCLTPTRAAEMAPP